MESDITELWQLVETLGNAIVLDLITQKGEMTRGTYIGSGKVDEILLYLQTHKVDTIILNGQLSPNQKFNLTKYFWEVNKNIHIWDRIDLILAIFSKHAKTTEAILQIELARMRHMGPRIYGMGMELSRQGGGIGTRGLGETNTELMQRHWKREIKKVKDQLDKIKETRTKQIENRKNLGIKTISLVGYTNAGKTSLFNALTHKKNLVENALFATLDSTVGEVYVQQLKTKVVVSDTIGFIANLPPDLIEAFTSTLMESVHADKILHIIDASDPLVSIKMQVVAKLLDDLHVSPEIEILVFNKNDLIDDTTKEKLIELAKNTPFIFTSAKTKENLETLLN